MYYVALVAHVGCTGAASSSRSGRAAMTSTSSAAHRLLGAVSEPSEDLRYFLRRFADDRPFPERMRLRRQMVMGGQRRFELMAANLCEGATSLPGGCICPSRWRSPSPS